MSYLGKSCLVFFIFILNIFIFSVSAFSKSNESCPAIWAEYSTFVYNEFNKSVHEPDPIFFVDTDGKAFDCLNLNVMQSEYQLVIAAQRSFAMTIEGNNYNRNDPNTWPINVCGFSSGNLSGVSFATVNLPYDKVILKHNSCKLRIMKSINRFLNKK